jgi:hypothetical protein
VRAAEQSHQHIKHKRETETPEITSDAAGMARCWHKL